MEECLLVVSSPVAIQGRCFLWRYLSTTERAGTIRRGDCGRGPGTFERSNHGACVDCAEDERNDGDRDTGAANRRAHRAARTYGRQSGLRLYVVALLGRRVS